MQLAFVELTGQTELTYLTQTSRNPEAGSIDIAVSENGEVR